MELKDIKQWEVEKGIAKPVNHHKLRFESFDTFGGLKTYVLNEEYELFEQGIKDHTYTTSAPDGIHSAEMFGEVVWQFMNVKFKWIDCVSNDNSFSKAHGFSTRQFLPFKQQAETITLDGETFVHNPDSKQRLDIIQPLNPNANAIKVIQDRIQVLQTIIGGDSVYDGRSYTKLDEAKHILKLLQS